MAEKLEAPQGIGELLRHFREERNLTRQMLADRVDVSMQTISNIELKNANYSVALLCRLAEALGISTDILLGRAPAGCRELDLLECAQILRENGVCIDDWMERDKLPESLRVTIRQYQEMAEKLLGYLLHSE